MPLFFIIKTTNLPANACLNKRKKRKARETKEEEEGKKEHEVKEPVQS